MIDDDHDHDGGDDGDGDDEYIPAALRDTPLFRSLRNQTISSDEIMQNKDKIYEVVMTKHDTTTYFDSDVTEPAHRLGALTARMQAYRFKMDILDGKAQLDEVFTSMDAAQQKNNQGRVVILN
ncbi:MAG: hypothetical protein ACRD4J_03150 [Nitrososphaeraceae archaeon]